MNWYEQQSAQETFERELQQQGRFEPGSQESPVITWEIEVESEERTIESIEKCSGRFVSE